MESLNNFVSWAWERHHNVLSWYIRPFFLLPFCYFAYRRSLAGILLTLVALSTSMFWFPAPEKPDPGVAGFLAAEKEYLTGGWTLAKVFLASLVPLSLTTLGLAFWKRSLACGLVVLNAIAWSKVAWSFSYGGASGGLAVLTPALMGLVVSNVVILYAARKVQSKARRRRPAPAPDRFEARP